MARGGIFIPIVGDEADLVRALKKAEDELRRFGGQTAQVSKSVAQRAGEMGSKLTRSLTPVAGAISLGLGKAFSDLDAGLDAIRTGTGATGDALTDLGASMKTVAGQVTQPLAEVGATLADLSTRTGLVGKPLEALTRQVLELSRITGTDAQTNVAAITRVFGDWGVAADDQTATLDRLFRASQATGIGVDELASKAVAFGAPLRQMGFGLDQTAALLGKFEKEGVNTELVMGSLRIALGKMARSGEKDVPKAFGKAVAAIEDAGSAGEANALALELFGARAGPDMAAAIREGRFALGKLFDQVSDGSETIEAANRDTLDLSDKLAMLRNRVVSAIGPFGEVGSAIFGAVAAIGPALLGFSQLGPAIGGVSKALTFLAANPIVLAVAALAGAIAIAIKFRTQFVAGLKRVRDVAVRILGAIGRFITTWGPLLLGPIGFVIKFRDQIATFLGKARDVVVRILGRIRDFWGNVWGGLKDTFAGAWDGIKSLLRSGLNFVIRGLNTLLGALNKVVDGIDKALGPFINLPDVPRIPEIPAFAAGGIVRKPTIGLLGERGAEAVIPLRRNSGIGSSITVNVTVQGSVAAEQDIARSVRDELVKLQRRNVTTGLE